MKHSKPKVILLSVMALFVAGCGGGGATIQATIGGSVAGLAAGAAVGLLDNGTDARSVGANGSFAFATQIQAGSNYNVTVSTQPSGEICTVTGGLGTVGQTNSDISSVFVNCVATTSVNNSVTGSVSGLTPNNTVTLLNNGTDQVIVGNGNFAFPPLKVGATYSIVVSVQPPSGQTCTFTVPASAVPGQTVTPTMITGTIPSIGTIPTVGVTCS